MKVREVIKRLEADGYVLARTRGGHRQFRAPDGSHLVTVPGKPNDTLRPGTLASIRRATGLEELR
ncbi:MAG: type II toxin-antitoxin system HicA family toxin [Solirubrobacterales bacterium]|nr:type II toxin-antitoxin system HicA family toxin [Solirubrobacterales bacterium]